MSNFHIPIEKPEEIIPRLGKRDAHWKKGRSAYELSSSWMSACGIPIAVSQALDRAEEWRGAELLEGIFERETPVPGKGRPSQTDLLAIVRLTDGNAVIGVEGKVDETFGPLVSDWLAEAKDDNRQARFTGLCQTLGANAIAIDGLYYQLFHRTCASIYEARRFGYRRAMMLVHSFAPIPTTGEPAGFPEFRRFSEAVRMTVDEPGAVSASKRCEGVEMRLGWVSDKIAD